MDTTALLAIVGIGACSDPLEVHIVGTVTDASVNNAAAANALRIGALGSINAMTTSTPWRLNSCASSSMR